MRTGMLRRPLTWAAALLAGAAAAVLGCSRSGQPPAPVAAGADPDVLLAAYRTYDLPLPPATARLAALEPEGLTLINGKRVRYRYLVWLIEPAGAGRPARIFSLLKLDETDSPVAPVDADAESIEEGDWQFMSAPSGGFVPWGRETEGLAMGIQAHALGRTDLARALIAKYRRGFGDTGPWDADRDLAEMAWNYWCGRLGEKDADRRTALRCLKLACWALRHPQQTDGARSPEPDDPIDASYTNLVADLEATVNATLAPPGTLDALFDNLTESTSRDPARCGTYSPKDAGYESAYYRLWTLGFEAVPALLGHYDDRRLTRVIAPAMMNSPASHVRVCEQVGWILCELSGKDLWDAQAPRRQVSLKAAEAWWQQARARGEEAWLLDNVLYRDVDGTMKLSAHRLGIMQARYGRHLGGLYERVLREHPGTPAFDLVDILAAGDLPREEKLRLFLAGARSEDGTQRRLAIRQLMEMNEPNAVELLIDAVRRIPRTPDGAYWHSDAGQVCALAAWTDDDGAWQAVEDTARGVDVGQRMEILQMMSSCVMEGRPTARRLALVARFLDDGEIRDTRDDPQKYDGPCAGFCFPRLAVRDLAAMTAAGLLDLKIDPDPSWTETDWAALRQRVRQTLAERPGKKP